MSKFDVQISDPALEDLAQIYRYIARVLGQPDTAEKIYDRITKAIFSLDEFPARIGLVGFEPERSQGLRRMNAGSYAIFFVIEGSSVTVTDILYGASDVRERLR